MPPIVSVLPATTHETQTYTSNPESSADLQESPRESHLQWSPGQREYDSIRKRITFEAVVAETHREAGEEGEERAVMSISWDEGPYL